MQCGTNRYCCAIMRTVTEPSAILLGSEVTLDKLSRQVKRQGIDLARALEIMQQGHVDLIVAGGGDELRGPAPSAETFVAFASSQVARCEAIYAIPLMMHRIGERPALQLEVDRRV